MEYKKCSKCKLERPITDFYFSATPKRQHRCKFCQSVYGKKHYAANKEVYAARGRQRRVTHRQPLFDYVAKAKNAPCTDCKVQYPPYVMDFDHINPANKSSSVAGLISSEASIERIQEEIDKCELVCSNCHRERTASRRRALAENTGA